MTKEEIIEMANHSSFTKHWEFEKCLVCNLDSLYHFAKLVAEKEREECAKIFDDAKGTGRIASCREAADAIRARGQE